RAGTPPGRDRPRIEPARSTGGSRPHQRRHEPRPSCGASGGGSARPAFCCIARTRRMTGGS
ncbi:hypothetical protein ACPXAU_23510, partial [Salmonella enterica]|uniref:hypothetical protein n=1 Tax=Salmonella enterica TaxID=28901 RepID=UPI003CF99F06